MDIKRIRSTMRTACAVCEKRLASPIIEFPRLPLTEIYTNIKPKKEIGFVDQFFHVCQRCGHGQLGRIVDPQVLYGQQAYFFRTSTSASAKRANDVFVTFIKKHIKNKKLNTLVEIGSSDLYLIRTFTSQSKRLVGIDPILKGKEQMWSRKNVIAVGDFYENVDLNNYLDEPNSLVVTSHTLEHIADPMHMLKTLFASCHPDTLFIFQFPGFETLIRDQRYDEIFHQHLHYFSLASFEYLLAKAGGELIDHAVNPQHWGSLLVAFRKARRHPRTPRPDRSVKTLTKKIRSDYADFQNRMQLTGKLISETKGKLYGYGAALMLPILAYHLRIDFSQFECIIDDDPQKNGLYYINLPVVVKPLVAIRDIETSTVTVTALNAMKSIIPKVIALHPRRIIIPMPTL